VIVFWGPILKIFWDTFVHGKSYVSNLTKKWVGHVWGDFLTNSSGHPSIQPTAALISA
jgi:hypothetical protein